MTEGEFTDAGVPASAARSRGELVSDLRTTPLHDRHSALGASFTDFGGWSMPVRYTSDLAEHHAVRQAAGLFDISHMAEFTLRGPGAGGIETASAVVADLVSVVGTSGTGFLQNDACWRDLPMLDPADWTSRFYAHLDVADQPGVLGHAATVLAGHGVSIARLVQHLEPPRAALDLVLHDAMIGSVEAALDELAASPDVFGRPFIAPVIAG